MSDSVRPHRQQPTRLPHPWDSPGKNTGVGCHCLLQCMKVKSESEVAQSCLTLSNPMDCSLPGSSVHGIFQARGLEWDAIWGTSKPHSHPHPHCPGSQQRNRLLVFTPSCNWPRSPNKVLPEFLVWSLVNFYWLEKVKNSGWYHFLYLWQSWHPAIYVICYSVLITQESLEALPKSLNILQGHNLEWLLDVSDLLRSELVRAGLHRDPTIGPVGSGRLEVDRLHLCCGCRNSWNIHSVPGLWVAGNPPPTPHNSLKKVPWR